MTMNLPKKMNTIDQLIRESASYTSLENMESLVQNEEERSPKPFHHLPIEPLYMALKKMPHDRVALYLPKFSKAQRELFLDIDLWNKDEVDLEHFSWWIESYSQLTENDHQVRFEFSSSEQFLMYLKGKFNIWTFDLEEPEYPDHDRFFLTDDNLLLFEYDETFHHYDEVKNLIRDLYSELGVEGAYTFLFKLVSDSFLILQENEYQNRQNRLRDIGMVDYLEALQMESPFAHKSSLDKFVLEHKSPTGKLTSFSKEQSLPNDALLTFREGIGDIMKDLSLIVDESRQAFLQFNFIRLINGRLEFTNSLKKGSVAMARTGVTTRHILNLGFNYIKFTRPTTDDSESVFNTFTFEEVYKIGNSLIKLVTKDLKKELTKWKFIGDEEKFLGDHWMNFLDRSFELSPQYLNGSDITPITSLEIYEKWNSEKETLISLLPFISSFAESWKKLVDTGKVHDSFYLNYTIDNINFESIILSSLAVFSLYADADSDKLNEPKLGITVEEFIKFHTLITGPSMKKLIKNFLAQFKLNHLPRIENYFQTIIEQELMGLDVESLELEEFKHMGGPIILYQA